MQEERIGMQFHKINQLIKRNYDKHLKSVKLTGERWAIIRDLYVREQKYSQSSATAFIIASRMEEEEKKVEVFLDQMVKEDWLVSVQNPTDRRVSSYFLSQKSQKIIPFLMEQDDYVEKEFLKGFSDEEKEILAQMMKRIENNIKR